MAAAQHPAQDPFEENRRELQGPAEVDPPELESLGAGVGYVASFPKALARVTIDGVRQGRDGLRGDVRVEVGPFGDGRYRVVNEARLELSSMSQRETWERVLRKREPSFKWDDILHRFAAAVLQAEKRLDKPAILLRDAQRPATTGMLLDPLLAARFPTLWYGDGDTAKSLLALAAGASVHAGVPLIGRLHPAGQLRVLMADFEFEDWEHRERLRQLLRLRREDPSEALPDIAYIDCRGSTISAQVERIMAAARAYESEFLIVDSISYAADGPLNDDETARLYYRALGVIGLPSLSIGHTPKNGHVDSPFGSVHWRNLCRLAWQFQRCGEEDGDEALLKLTCRKHNSGQRATSLGFRLLFERDAIVIESADPRQMAGSADSLWRQVAVLLGREKRLMTYAEIALALGQDEKLVRTRIGEKAGDQDVFVLLPPESGSRARRVGLRAGGEGGF